FQNMEIRRLVPSDEESVEAFLRAHRDSSMFLRSNLRQAGLVYRGEAFQAIYLAVFREGAIEGIAAHAWNGMLLVQAPVQMAELVRACIAESGRSVTGFTGPLDQVRTARLALGLEDAPAALEGEEALYALDLADLVIPEALSSGRHVCRAPRSEERDMLIV